jgi:hypothetical protein
MDASGASSPLSAADLDLTNETVALGYLAAILDDSELQVKDNEFSKAFWYGIVAVIGIATLFNVIQRVTLMLRSVLFQTLLACLLLITLSDSAPPLPTDLSVPTVQIKSPGSSRPALLSSEYSHIPSFHRATMSP